MKDNKINNFIHQTCLSKGWGASDLERAIDDAIVEHELNLDIRDKSTINKWFNGKQTPDSIYYPAVALALGVSEDELRAGRRLNSKVLEDTIKELESLRNADLKEKETALRFLWMSKYYHRLFGGLLLSGGLFLLNATYWKNGLIYLVSFIFIVLVIRYDRRKYKEEVGIKEERSLLESIRNEIKEDLDFIKFTFGNSLLSRVSSLFLIIVIVLAFMPFVESCFYKGQFALSATLYILLGLVMMARSLEK